MKKKDHLALARHLLAMCDDRGLHAHRSAFLLGSVEPDLNWFTYLRGLRSGKKLHGHNAENSAGHILRATCRLMNRGLESSWDYFTLGALLHYVADTFTSVHNSFNDMSVKDHLAYEMKLHDHLMERLASPQSVTSLTIPYSLICHLKEMHRDYSAHEPSVENDVEHIIRSCATILFWALRCLSTEEETVFSYQAI